MNNQTVSYARNSHQVLLAGWWVLMKASMTVLNSVEYLALNSGEKKGQLESKLDSMTVGKLDL